MSSWRFLIIHTCWGKVASNRMGWQMRGQLPRLLVKRAQRGPTAELGGPCSRGRDSSGRENIPPCIFKYVCVHVEQKGKWKEITGMEVDAVRGTRGEHLCREMRHQPGPDCQLPIIIPLFQKLTKKVDHLCMWHTHIYKLQTHTHTQGSVLGPMPFTI